ncbi:hypothetical protein HMPREF0620_0607 [Parascardovia denticolens DSM 10105 = JCM 12538]|uniref:Uncharacterized protein n=1 Tax=Parascardovia denticolens DSM 10105 = JCM 12538 TaxID=864564 RepID=E6K1C1_PARDN|nr:hypothetical protein HMPREF0620_0607 [Parascardovia denticolens DSM 10105 = JCM 12538]
MIIFKMLMDVVEFQKLNLSLCANRLRDRAWNYPLPLLIKWQ